METSFNLGDLDSKAFHLSFKSPSSDIEDDDAASKKYKCKYPGCDKVFRYRSEIVRHTVTHTNQRSYICPYKDCQKAFKRSDALATHLRIHTGDKPYKCPVGSCQLSFSTKAGLRYHVLKHKNDKIFRCEFAGCDQSFLTLSQLKQHQRGAKVHENLIDSKSVTYEDGRNTDLSSHVGETASYEPPIIKRQHIEPQLTSVIKIANNVNNLNNPFGLDKPHELSQNHLLPLNILAHNTLNNPHPQGLNALNMASAAFNQNHSSTNEPATAKTSGSPDDQAALLKKINKILDENTVLKKHLEICQKIISIYQTNMNSNNNGPNNNINNNNNILRETGFKL